MLLQVKHRHVGTRHLELNQKFFNMFYTVVLVTGTMSDICLEVL